MVTGCTCKVRQKITREADDVIYLVTCKKYNIQGVGCTTELEKRISNYPSHYNKRNISCGITEHFLEEGHKLDEVFMIKPILKFLNPPRTVCIQCLNLPLLRNFQTFCFLLSCLHLNLNVLDLIIRR